MNHWIANIEFENPWFFLLLGLVPFIMYWRLYRTSRKAYYFPLPSLRGVSAIRSFRQHLYTALPWIRLLIFVLLVVGLTRPRLALKEEQVKAEGIDIMMIIDLSSSMLSRDFTPNRLEASKEVATRFISNRPYDRIGLTVFSGEAFTLCPLTPDHQVLGNLIGDIQAGILTDGTALGNGLSAAVNRLIDSDAISKVAILLTDGVNNRGYIEPATAIEIAREFGVKVYTIGVGTNGLAQSPVGKNRSGDYYYDYVQVNIDEALLREIARETGGKYYRATNEAELQQVYDEIDALEKTEIELNVFKRYSDEFDKLIWLAFLLLLAEVVLRLTIVKTLPS